MRRPNFSIAIELRVLARKKAFKTLEGKELK
jgi:hypothetical protein